MQKYRWTPDSMARAVDSRIKDEYCYYAHPDVEKALSAKDRDLADANHALLLANRNADAFKRVAEQRQGEIERLRRAVEWCLLRGAFRCARGRIWIDETGSNDYFEAAEVPAEFAEIIKPTTGASNG